MKKLVIVLMTLSILTTGCWGGKKEPKKSADGPAVNVVTEPSAALPLVPDNSTGAKPPMTVDEMKQTYNTGTLVDLNLVVQALKDAKLEVGEKVKATRELYGTSSSCSILVAGAPIELYTFSSNASDVAEFIDDIDRNKTYLDHPASVNGRVVLIFPESKSHPKQAEITKIFEATKQPIEKKQ